MSSVKVPDGRYTLTGRESLQEICRFHSADSRLVDGSTDGQGQSDLGTPTCKTNWKVWNLARGAIRKSKIKWAINIFKRLKLAGID